MIRLCGILFGKETQYIDQKTELINKKYEKKDHETPMRT